MALAYFFLLIPILLAGLVLGIWFLSLVSARAGADAIRKMPYRDFLGPGGPDDPFTVRIPREEYEAMLSGPHRSTQVAPAARDAGDQQVPHADRRIGLIRRPHPPTPRSSITAGRGAT
jgi:hypothetical protein